MPNAQALALRAATPHVWGAVFKITSALVVFLASWLWVTDRSIANHGLRIETLERQAAARVELDRQLLDKLSSIAIAVARIEERIAK